MKKNACAFNVAQELMSQTGPLMGPFNQSRDVGHRIAPFAIQKNNPQLGLSGGKGIGRNFGVGTGNDGEEGGFAGIGSPHQSHIGEQLELKADLFFLALFSRFGMSRGLMGGCCEVHIATTASSSLGHNDTLFGTIKVLDQEVVGLVVDKGSHGDFYDEILAGDPVQLFALAVSTPGGLEVATVSVVQEGEEIGIGLDDDVSAPSSIPAIRSSTGDVFFPPKGTTALAPIAGLDVDSCLINKFHNDAYISFMGEEA